MEYDIFYPTPIDEIKNLDNDNIDVCIRFIDGRAYTIVITTPQNLAEIMARNGEDYISPMYKYIVVKRIEPSIISNVVRELVMNQDLLRYYGCD